MCEKSHYFKTMPQSLPCPSFPFFLSWHQVVQIECMVFVVIVVVVITTSSTKSDSFLIIWPWSTAALRNITAKSAKGTKITITAWFASIAAISWPLRRPVAEGRKTLTLSFSQRTEQNDGKTQNCNHDDYSDLQWIKLGEYGIGQGL